MGMILPGTGRRDVAFCLCPMASERILHRPPTMDLDVCPPGVWCVQSVVVTDTGS
jgi:hypothetical protein